MTGTPRTLGILQAALQAAHLRHAALSQNLANANTPGYKALDVRFESELQAALAAERQGQDLQPVQTHPRHLGTRGRAAPARVQPVLVRATGTAMRHDGNNVDLEAQVAMVAANQIWYQALVRMVGDELHRYRLAITEGRR